MIPSFRRTNPYEIWTPSSCFDEHIHHTFSKIVNTWVAYLRSPDSHKYKMITTTHFSRHKTFSLTFVAVDNHASVTNCDWHFHLALWQGDTTLNRGHGTNIKELGLSAEPKLSLANHRDITITDKVHHELLEFLNDLVSLVMPDDKEKVAGNTRRALVGKQMIPKRKSNESLN